MQTYMIYQSKENSIATMIKCYNNLQLVFVDAGLFGVDRACVDGSYSDQITDDLRHVENVSPSVSIDIAIVKQ